MNDHFARQLLANTFWQAFLQEIVTENSTLLPGVDLVGAFKFFYVMLSI